MSFLKGFVLAVFAVLLIVCLIIFQVDNTVNNTVLSGAYFNKQFDKFFTPESMKGFATYLKKSVGDVEDKDMKKILQDAIDVKWMQKDMPAFIKGSYSFFTSGEGKLPVISIKPMKEAVTKAVEAQAGIGSTLAVSYLGLDKMKDTFDPNVYFNKLYGSGVNPVTGLGDVVSGTGRNFFLLIVITALLLFAVIAVIAWHPRGILKWGGACLVVAGLLCALPALIPMVFHNAINTSLVSAVSGGEADLAFFGNFLMSFLSGAATYMLVQGLVVALVGVALLVSAGFMRHDEAPSRHVAVRVVAALVLLAAIPFSAYFIARGYYTDYVRAYVGTQKMHEKMKPGDAFDATMGGKIGKLFFSSEK